MVDIFNPQRGLAQVSKATDFIEGKVDTAQQFIEDKKQSITDYFTREQALKHAIKEINRFPKISEYLKEVLESPESTDIPMDITPDDRTLISQMAEIPLTQALRWAESTLDQGKAAGKKFLNSEILPIFKSVEDQLAAFPAVREMLPSYRSDSPSPTVLEEPQAQTEEFRVSSGPHTSQSLENFMMNIPYKRLTEAMNRSKRGLGMDHLYNLMPEQYQHNERARNMFVNLAIKHINHINSEVAKRSQVFLGQVADDTELMETYGQTNPEVAATKYSNLPEPAIDRKPLVTRPRMEASPDLGLRTGGFATRPSYY